MPQSGLQYTVQYSTHHISNKFNDGRHYHNGRDCPKRRWIRRLI